MAKNKRQLRGMPGIRPSQPAAEVPSDFNPDYSYVAKDLKRIGTLAGLFFTVLVVIAVVMPFLGK
ncbi:MAG: hypothetical protein ACOYYS_03680 [Chloroflexota bacterium]